MSTIERYDVVQDVPDADPVALWPDELRAAFIAAWAELSAPSKSSTAEAGSYSYRYADLAAVDRAIRDVIAQHGLATTVDVVLISGVAHVSTTLLHASGIGRTSWLSFRLPRDDVQTAGGVVTYLRRYQLLALFGLAPEDDDAASARARPQHAYVDEARTTRVQQLRTLLAQLGVDDATMKHELIAEAIGHEYGEAIELHPDDLDVAIAALVERLERSQAGADDTEHVDSADDAADVADEHTAPARDE